MECQENFVLDSDKGYLFCCAGLGDTMLLCGFLDALEKKYDFHMCLILKKTHAFIAQMYEIKDYLIVDVDIPLSYIRKGLKRYPEKGKVFAAHPCEHLELRAFFEPIYNQTSTVKFLPWFREFLGIDKSEKLILPTTYPQITKELRERCERFAPISEIVLFSPEATSMLGLPDQFWENKAKKLHENGFTIISNVINPENTVSHTKYLDLSVKDAVALALECHSLYALRSGFCDLLFSMGERMHVFYSSHSALFLYSLNDMFGTDAIDEQIILD